MQTKIKVADLDAEGSEYKMAKGGNGGAGNLEKKNLHILERGQQG
jgi:GTPase involved in cell partitioning and DNA repair